MEFTAIVDDAAGSLNYNDQKQFRLSARTPYRRDDEGYNINTIETPQETVHFYYCGLHDTTGFEAGEEVTITIAKKGK